MARDHSEGGLEEEAARPARAIRRRRRLRLEGRWAGNAVAFRGDGRTVVVVRNPFARAERAVLALEGRYWALELEPESLNTLVVESRPS